MKLDLNENDMLLATILLLAGAIAAIALKQMDIISAGAQYQVLPPIQQSYNVPVLGAQPQTTQMIESECVEEPMVIFDATQMDMPETSPVVYRSPATFMGYNVDDELVSIARRLPDGSVVRRKIRDPEIDIGDLSVDRWVEFNQYEDETDMTWV